MFKFQDFDGKMLALRAEMTAPVARIVSTKMASMSTPIRLFYVSNVFRYSQSYLEREREFWQAGVELIGTNTVESDAEILALLVSSLKNLGLKDLRLDIGDASLLKGLLKITKLDEEKKRALRSLLVNRNKAQLEVFMDQNVFSPKLKEAFIKLSCCRRLDEAASVSLESTENRKTNNYLKKLSQLRDALKDYGVENLVFFDFSLTRRIEYYTGLVFEASVPNFGLPLGGGGRYDHFIEKFGKLKLPATGFALEMEKILKALAAQQCVVSEKLLARVLVSSKNKKVAIKAVNILRDAKLSASLNTANNSKARIIKSAKQAGIDYVLLFGDSLNEPATICDICAGTSEKSTLQSIIQKIRG